MITEKDLHEAIAECQGARNPNANTCIKLAAYYTILQHMYQGQDQPEDSGYSFSGAPEEYTVDYDGSSPFADAIRGKKPNAVLAVMDELMDAVSVLQPRLYDSTMRKIGEVR